MVLDSRSRGTAARQAEKDRQSPRDWVHRYNEFGVDALLPRCRPGPAQGERMRGTSIEAIPLSGRGRISAPIYPALFTYDLN